MAIVQREGRRRRVLREDSGSGETAKSRTRSSIAGPYADEALVELQPRVTDLIPNRIRGLALVLLLGIVSIATVQASYYYRTHKLSHVNYQIVAGLDLCGTGTITNWLASVYLLVSGAAALLVFNTRRHKVDDYYGRYSLWVWTAAACTLASLDASTGLHRLVQYGLTQATGTALWRDGSIWWILIWGLIGLVVGGRAMIDMWPSRGGVFFLSVAAIGYAFSAIVYLGVYTPSLGPYNAILHSSVLLLSHFLLLYSFLLYARSIHRMAQGLVLQKQKSTKAQSGWWTRQVKRLSESRLTRRTERDARHESRREAKLAKANAKLAGLAEAREKALAEKQRKQDAKNRAKIKQKTPADSNSSGNEQPKKPRPLEVQRKKANADGSTQYELRDRRQASQVPSGTQSDAIDVDQMSADELEMEMLTNPNLSRAERRTLRKRLKQEQQQQRRAA